MNPKTLVWLGFGVGSTVGSYVPTLWGGDLFSFSGLFCSFIGGIAGIWGAYKLSQIIDG